MKRFFFLSCILCCTLLSAFSQSFTDSNLPIVLINTDGGVGIPDAPRVFANMKIIYRGQGLRNYLNDQNTIAYINYNGRINIETRGSSSQTLPKKQYGLTTYKADNTTKLNVSLLGLPADNDWILNGLGFEPSLIRDYLCYNLSRMMGEYASRTVYCEVLLNGSYIGLYVLQEKIKQGSDRVNVKKILSTDNTYPDVTGGYITKADKTNTDDPVAWTMASYVPNSYVTFIHSYPGPTEVTSQQNDYIHSEFIKLSNTVMLGNSSFESGYPSVIDIPSFVDFMIISEFSANADAYQFSTYFNKDRNGKLRAGPIWDNNLTFDYDLAIWNYDRSKYNLWQFWNGDNEGAKFWRDLFNNTEFKCCLARRWNQLIQPGQPLNETTVDNLIDKTVALISEAAVRENARWSTVPNLASEIVKIKDFVKKRIDWMTTNMGPTGNCPVAEIPPLVISKIMYNPATSVSFPIADEQEFLEITNTGSKSVNLTGVYFSNTGFVYQFPAYSQIAPHSTKMLANKVEVFRARYGFEPSGQFNRNLSDAGQCLVLADGFGNVIDSVRYSSKPPWPDASGNGYYLELIDPLSDNSLASNWRASMSTIVSVNDTEDNMKMKFYPSPVTDYLTIESSGTIRTLELFDSQGRSIRKTEVNSGLYKLDMSACSQGMYLIRVVTQNGSYMHKIIKE